MNKPIAALLEQHFDTAFAAPDGIKKLRELILTLAMQGKLVPQDPNDPPASELLKGNRLDPLRNLWDFPVSYSTEPYGETIQHP